ncbi:DUF898 family protein [uncultured Tateyamaria sp.]|uniref:YjgN family protein n=1 Tax=uncultured Tateyamaria sp. TaxID=455651 RepID=UPI0026307B0B|nr:DUF898 family protein [uncultured Tateyamaria sp.]
MSKQIQGKYFGTGGPLFRLYMVTALLTLVTLGIYRFWAKTRLRTYVWSAASADDDSFEYTGTGLEKFLGFLVAIVILALYLGLVQILLTFVGLSIVPDSDSPAAFAAQSVAINLSVLSIVPLMLFAQYRARRYKLARTRWRGIRFGMDKGAWGYAFRAMGYYLLTIITVGMLAPLGTYRLEKYMADRTWFGDAPFEQHGRWQALYAGMKHVFISLGLFVVAIGAFVFGASTDQAGFAVLGGILAVVGYIWFLVGLLSYRVFAFNYLTGQKVLDGQIRFRAQLRTPTLVGIFLIGSVVIGLVMGAVFGVIGGLFAASGEAIMTGTASPLLFVAIALLYGGAFLVAGALSMILITQPVIEHAVENVTVFEAEHLDAIRQRAADTGADAEGFADALDVGGAL